MNPIQKGINLISENKIEDAFDFFYSLVQVEPKNVDAWIYLARSSFKLHGNHEHLYKYLERAYRLEPDNPIVLVDLVWYYLIEDILDIDKAQEFFEKAKSKSHEGLDMIHLEAKIAYRLADYEKAKSNFLECLYYSNDLHIGMELLLSYGYLGEVQSIYEIYPELIDIYGERESKELNVYRAIALSLTDAPEKAIPFLEEALLTHSEYSNIYRALGNCYTQVGKFENALEVLLKGIALTEPPDDLDFIIELTYYYSQSGQKEKEVEQLLKWYDRTPTNELAYNIGAGYFVLEEYEKAESYLQLVFNANPNKAHYDLLFDCYSRSDSKKLIELVKNHGETFKNKEEIVIDKKIKKLIKQKGWKQLYQYLLDLLDSKPKNYQYHKYLGGCNYQLGDLNEAFHNFSNANEYYTEKKEHNYFDLILSELCIKKGEIEKSKMFEEKGRRIAGDNYYLHLGHSFASFHENELACDSYEKQHEITPNHPENLFCLLNYSYETGRKNNVLDVIRNLIPHDIYTVEGAIQIQQIFGTPSDTIILIKELIAENKVQLSWAYYYWADVLYDLGEITEAHAMIEKSLAEDPNSNMPLELKAVILKELGDTENATEYLKKAVQVNPLNTSPVKELIRQYMAEQNYDLVISYGEQNVSHFDLEYDKETILKILDAYAISGRLNEGISFLERLEKEKLTFPEALIVGSVFYGNFEEEEDRKIRLEKLLTQFPELKKLSYLMWGKLYFDLGFHEKVIEFLKNWEAIKLKINGLGKRYSDDLAFTLFTKSYQKIGDKENAEFYFRALINFLPEDKSLAIQFAEFLYVNDKKWESYDLLMEILIETPDYHPAHSCMAVVISGLSEKQDEYLVFLEKIAPEYAVKTPIIFLNLAQLYSAINNVKECHEYFQKANERDLLFSNLDRHRWAVALKSLKYFDRAIEQYVILHDNYNSKQDTLLSPFYFSEFADIHYVYGDYEQALFILEEGLHHFPDDDNLERCAGNCLMNLGKYEEANTRYLKALEINPNNVDANTGVLMVLAFNYNWKEVIEYAERQHEIFCLSTNAMPKMILAKAYIAVNHYKAQKGEALFDEATNEGAPLEWIYTLKAEAYKDISQISNAKKVLKDGFEKCNGDSTIGLYLALIYQSEGNYEKWGNHLRVVNEAIETASTVPRVVIFERDYSINVLGYINRFIFRNKEQAKTNFINHFNQTRFNPKRIIPIIEMETFEFENPTEARRYFEKLKALAENNIALHDNSQDRLTLCKGLLIINQSDSTEKAKTHALRALDLNSSAFLAHQYLGVIALYKKDYEAAIRSLETYLTTSEEDQVRFQLGRALFLNDQIHQAKQNYKKLQDNTNSSNLRAFIGACEIELCQNDAPGIDKYEVALNHIKQALTILDNENAVLFYRHIDREKLVYLKAQILVQMALKSKSGERKMLKKANAIMEKSDFQKGDAEYPLKKALLVFHKQKRLYKPLVQFLLLGLSACSLLIAWTNYDDNFDANQIQAIFAVPAAIFVAFNLERLPNIKIKETSVPISFHKSYFEDFVFDKKAFFNEFFNRDLHELM